MAADADGSRRKIVRVRTFYLPPWFPPNTVGFRGNISAAVSRPTNRNINWVLGRVEFGN